ncbi:MAG TPA: YdcH family protein [Bryobacteraceae bacterium]|nr:YdcH family protein [Bryobacteraceae bacterium]HOL73588.1 YdcH family protein [Bryobacteraceae bacterium]HOQ46507.1 YdcH family protein [Bryobacteraceae bacterium]HPQ14202.1 YdcH family protein [Bryobacteraceae bacterium]HPU72665.1 YdcH family protein [Bryobacteraceae bacterium]
MRTPEELKAHLMETDEQFRLLAEQHREYKKRVEALSSRPYLTPEEQLEVTRIKKLKLRLKDQMQEIMERYRHEHQTV